jgi:ADP-ribose pyrophosphatase YjhB (NUDIX family)
MRPDCKQTCGIGGADQTRAPLDISADPGGWQNGAMKPEPRLGCAAAIVVDNRILLIQRLAAPEALHWGLPGGKVEWLEPVTAAVAREVWEELGITIHPTRLLCVCDQIDPAAGTHWLAPVYLVDDYEGEPKVMEPDKHAACGWFRLYALQVSLTAAARMALESLI